MKPERGETKMPKALPFSQVKDGLAIWDVECDDPQAAQEHPAELRARRLPLPDGEVLALALRIFDVKGKPQLHHLAGPLDRAEVQAWAQALKEKGGLSLVLQHSGWATVYERRVKLNEGDWRALSAPHSPGRDPEASIRLYLERYRSEFPRLHQPEAVWEAILSPASAAAPRRGGGSWFWLLLALAAAGAAAWVYFKR
jgi:hypothetical protein